MKTFNAKKEEVQRDWVLIDAADQVLGRVAVEIATILRGKNKAIFTPHVDTGDFVVVVNAEKVRLTGNKLTGKIYYRHTQYPGHLKATTARDLLAKKPTEVLRHAVRGMLPKNHLGRELLKKLKIYAGPSHPHAAQLPKAITG
jgi:large subunit ribosomal protein L13